VKPKIKITLIAPKGTCGCRRGHRIGDRFDYDTERGKKCSMHVAFPHVDILRHGGVPLKVKYGEVRFCCPDCDVINIFKIEEEVLHDGAANF